MRYWQIIGISLILIVIYIFSINFLASIISIVNEKEVLENQNGNGADVKIGMADSVSVSVIRKSKLIFFRTHENNGNSYFKIFNLITLPKKVGFNFIYFHIIFLILITIFILNEIGKVNIYKEQPPY